MTYETDLRERLKDDAGISAIIGQSSGHKTIDWNERPQDMPFPSIVMDTVFGDRSQHMGGFNSFQPARTQFRCTAKDRSKAIALREAVIACIAAEATEGETWFLRSQQISHFSRVEKGNSGTLHHEFVDAQIWHGPSPVT